MFWTFHSHRPIGSHIYVSENEKKLATIQKFKSLKNGKKCSGDRVNIEDIWHRKGKGLQKNINQNTTSVRDKLEILQNRRRMVIHKVQVYLTIVCVVTILIMC